MFVEIPYGLELAQTEKASVAHLLEKSSLIFGMVNDLYSFPKEFEEHSRAETLDMIHNGISLLMHGYGYSEEEARNILRQEISAAEKDLLDSYRAWELSHAEKCSEMLRKYVVYYILALGGWIYWHSHTQRYHRLEFTTTVEDRAQLVTKDRSAVRRLEGYPPPAAFGVDPPVASEQNHDKPNGVNHDSHEHQNPLLTNGDCSAPDFFAPFRSVTSEDVSYFPT